jgi:chromosome segregation ATPase
MNWSLLRRRFVVMSCPSSLAFDAALQNAYAKELSHKNSQILALEKSVNTLSKDKNSFFDELQLRQAEVESSQFHLESLQSQNTEIQYQLREATDRLGLVNEELAEARRLQDSTLQGPATSAEDFANLHAMAEAKYELKIADFKRQLAIIERERSEGEVEWSRKVRDKAREVERLQSLLDCFTRT